VPTLRPLLAGLLVAGIARAAVPGVPTLSPDQLRPGQKAVVRTVFAGDSSETFDAEIVGVVPGGRVEGDLILARATSPRVERTGVAQGMSGSPVYVDGRLIGALSSGWSFSREPVFGITPIGDMLDVLDHPDVEGGPETAGPVGVDPLPGRRVRYREWRWLGDDDSLPGPDAPPGTPRPLAGAPLALPLAVGNASPAAVEPLRALFEPMGLAVVPGGRDRAPRPARGLEPGDAVAVDLLRGDLNLSAIGTVTWRGGDRVLIFGHPFFQSGDVRLPLSTAHITTILGSLNTSFKIGTPGTPVGTATQDRRAAVAGRLGPSPRLLPMRVEVRGTRPRPQVFRFESVEDRALLPQMLSAAVVNSLMESGGGAAQQSIAWTVSLWRAGRELRLADLAAGDSPVQELLASVPAPLRFLAGNPFERFRADSITVSLETRPGRAESWLRSAALTTASVRPGGVARIRLQVEGWRGGRETLMLDVPVPEELPEGRYPLWLGGGLEADRFVSQRQPARFQVVSVADAWDRLAAARRSDALHAMLWARAPEVNSDGEDLPELPLSALAMLGSPQQAGDRSRRGSWAMVQEVRRPLERELHGQLVLELVVDRDAP